MEHGSPQYCGDGLSRFVFAYILRICSCAIFEGLFLPIFWDCHLLFSNQSSIPAIRCKSGTEADAQNLHRAFRFYPAAHQQLNKNGAIPKCIVMARNEAICALQ